MNEGMVKLYAITLFVLWIAAAWLTHVIACFMTSSWGFLIAGAIMAPIAVVHGTWLWF